MADDVSEEDELARVLPDEAPASRLEEWRARGLARLAEWTERTPILGALIESAERERASGGGLLAGGLAYRLFFWLVPVGLMVAAASSLAGHEPKANLESAAGSRGIAALVATAEREAMEANHGTRWYLLALGIGLSVWFGIGVVRSLNIVFALAWGDRIRKVRRPLLAGAVFTVLALALSVAATVLGQGVRAIGLGPVALSVAIVAVYTGVALGVAVIFPHADAPVRALLPGCALLSVGGLGVHAFVNVYLVPKLGRSIDTYGLLGAASVVLLWLYVIARLFTLSAFVNAGLWRRRERLDGQR